ncbi:uncharacterized protein LOC116538673 [Sapajus apella]|uniref:Uncharacterized protein LOC116538673 n=1 Tax=Sapajus apella TaxID=9515 RepID=A0A6J3GGY4_SAPAP|nr:uncharacterized protein LOC116538673 [Sapajus apella]
MCMTGRDTAVCYLNEICTSPFSEHCQMGKGGPARGGFPAQGHLEILWAQRKVLSNAGDKQGKGISGKTASHGYTRSWEGLGLSSRLPLWVWVHISPFPHRIEGSISKEGEVEGKWAVVLTKEMVSSFQCPRPSGKPTETPHSLPGNLNKNNIRPLGIATDVVLIFIHLEANINIELILAPTSDCSQPQCYSLACGQQMAGM